MRGSSSKPLTVTLSFRVPEWSVADSTISSISACTSADPRILCSTPSASLRRPADTSHRGDSGKNLRKDNSGMSKCSQHYDMRSSSKFKPTENARFYGQEAHNSPRENERSNQYLTRYAPSRLYGGAYRHSIEPRWARKHVPCQDVASYSSFRACC